MDELTMLSETLISGLQRYEIGAKIRALRGEKKIGLVQLGEHTGLSAALLSKIERGQLFPTLPTLLRIALVFGVGLEYFFLEPKKRATCAVVRKKDRLRLPDRPKKKQPSYFFQSLDFPVTDRKMQAFFAEFPAQSEPSEPHSHAGVELIYVINGQLAVTLEEQETSLSEGDAMYFESQFPHSYCRHGKGSCAAIVVVSP